MKNWKRNTPVNTLLISGLIVLGILIAGSHSVHAEALLQQPTVDIATVTSTPQGPIASVPEDELIIYVHSGPGPAPDYPIIGILVAGQKVPALGQSTGGDYVAIVYLGAPGGVGWVYRNLVQVTEALPMITPPPPPTPAVTPTLDPTLIARYKVDVAPTSLPTFTPPAPLSVPTFAPNSPSATGSRLPMGFIIIGLAVIGLFGTMLTILRGR